MRSQHEWVAWGKRRSWNEFRIRGSIWFLQDLAGLPDGSLNLFLGLSLLFLTLSSLIQHLFVFLSSSNGADIYKEATGFLEGKSHKVRHTSSLEVNWPWSYCGITQGFFQMNQEENELQALESLTTLSQAEWYEITTANADFHNSHVQNSPLHFDLYCAIMETWCLRDLLFVPPNLVLEVRKGNVLVGMWLIIPTLLLRNVAVAGPWAKTLYKIES